MKLITKGSPMCHECHRPLIPVVEIGAFDEQGRYDQESGGVFCLECLRAAVALLETILAPRQEEPAP